MVSVQARGRGSCWQGKRIQHVVKGALCTSYGVMTLLHLRRGHHSLYLYLYHEARTRACGTAAFTQSKNPDMIQTASAQLNPVRVLFCFRRRHDIAAFGTVIMRHAHAGVQFLLRSTHSKNWYDSGRVSSVRHRINSHGPACGVMTLLHLRRADCEALRWACASRRLGHKVEPDMTQTASAQLDTVRALLALYAAS